MSTRTNDDLREIFRRLGELESAGARRLVREGDASPGVRGNLIYAQVDGSVSSGDPTGAFMNAVAIVGRAPTGGTGAFQNNFGQDYSTGDPIILFQRRDNNQWITERGGTAGSQVVAFRLIDDKSYADTAVLAKPVNADGTLNSGADVFYVVDHEHQFYGLAAYADEDSEAASWPGYLGYAVRYTDDYNDGESSGVPGYRIIAMEGPAQFVVVDLHDDVEDGEAGVDYVSSPNAPGRPFSGRRPRLEDGSPDANFTAFDDYELADSAKAGERWELKWEEAEEYYAFWRRLSSVVVEGGELYATTSTIDQATYSSGTLTPGEGTGRKLISQGDGTWDVDSVDVDLYNSVTTAGVANGVVVQVKTIDGYKFVDVEPC